MYKGGIESITIKMREDATQEGILSAIISAINTATKAQTTYLVRIETEGETFEVHISDSLLKLSEEDRRR